MQGLLASEAAVNARTPQGSTALSLAVSRRHTGVVRHLLAAGADANLRDGAGETPLLIASKFELVTHVGRPGVVVMAPTLTAGQSTPVAVVGSPLWAMEEIRNKEPEIARLLLDAGADPNAADPDGLTPLMFAAGQGRLELVQVLLAGGADVEAKAANGITAWQVATGEEVIRAPREARGRGGEGGIRCHTGVVPLGPTATARLDIDCVTGRMRCSLLPARRTDRAGSGRSPRGPAPPGHRTAESLTPSPSSARQEV